MQALEVIHGRILQKIGVLRDYNQYMYYTLVRFGNCARDGEVPPAKEVSVKTTQQLDNLDALAPVKKAPPPNRVTRVKDPSVDEYVDPVQSWVDMSLRGLAKETVRTERLRQLYRKISTPFVASQGDLGDFEIQLGASNIFDQMDEVYDAIVKVCRNLEVRMPDYKRVFNGLQQAPMTMDPISVDWADDAKNDPAVAQIAIECVGVNMKEFQRLCFADTTKLIEDKYHAIEISFPPRPKENKELCPECETMLIVDPFNSELHCQRCGYSDSLSGVVFEESQLYSQQSSTSKHKNYKFNSHCEKWLNQIQARENRVIPEEVLEKVNAMAKREYTRSGVLRSMRDMKCREIRRWFKQLGLTKYNNNSALVRRYITGMNGEAVIPPQLTPEETHDILFDFSQAMEIYESFDKEQQTLATIGKTKVGNKPYYPYGLMKILIMRLKRGPRLDGLLECIHLQTETTLRKHDKVWKEICNRVPNFIYVPTNKALLSANYG